MTIETAKFEDIAAPSLILCPLDQFNPQALKNMGYYPIYNFYAGNYDQVMTQTASIQKRAYHRVTIPFTTQPLLA